MKAANWQGRNRNFDPVDGSFPSAWFPAQAETATAGPPADSNGNADGVDARPTLASLRMSEAFTVLVDVDCEPGSGTLIGFPIGPAVDFRP